MSGPEIRRLYYSTQEVCDLLKVRPYDLKQWEKKFPELKPSASKTGRRLFKPKDLEIIRHIKALVEKGHEDDEIQFILNHPDSTLPLQKTEADALSIHEIIQTLEEILQLLRSERRTDAGYRTMTDQFSKFSNNSEQPDRTGIQ